MIKSYIQYRKAAFFQLMTFLLIIILFIFISAWIIKLKTLVFLFLVIIFLSFIFIDRLFKIFTRKVLITLNDDSFEIVVKKMESDEQEKYFMFHLDEIRSYQIQFPNWRFAVIVFNLKSKKTVDFSFLTKKIDTDQEDAILLIESFHKLITDYNKKQTEDERISFSPSFYASQFGLYSIIALTILCIMTVIFFVVSKGLKVLPITLLLEIGLIIQIIIRRKSDAAYYKK